MREISIIHGSLSSLAEQKGTPLAETLLDVDIVVMMDTSGSMSIRDGIQGKSRYATACDELERLQQRYPGKIAVIAFSDQVRFCPEGIPVFLNGGTAIDRVLEYVKILDLAGMHMILISDGVPDDEEAALEVARTFTTPIGTIYTGPADNPAGRIFLERLSKASGGRSIVIYQYFELMDGIENLYLLP